MEIEDLRAFIMLADTLNFTRAASAMYVAQSTFSRQINRLEAEVGAALFERSSRSVTLTVSGRAFLPEARKQVEMWENALRQVKQANAGMLGELTLGFIRDNPNVVIPEIVRQYRREYSNVELRMMEYDQQTLIDDLAGGKVDLAVSFQEGIEPLEDLEIQILEESPICAVVPADHALCGKTFVQMAELREEPVVLIHPSSNASGYQNVINRCRRYGFFPKIESTAEAIPGLFLLIESGLGIAYLPKGAARIAPESIRFLPVSDCEDTITTVLAWKKDNPNPCLQGFLETMRRILLSRKR